MASPTHIYRFSFKTVGFGLIEDLKGRKAVWTEQRFVTAVKTDHDSQNCWIWKCYPLLLGTYISLPLFYLRGETPFKAVKTYHMHEFTISVTHYLKSCRELEICLLKWSWSLSNCQGTCYIKTVKVTERAFQSARQNVSKNLYGLSSYC
jgi:hypothetical protein